MTPSREWSPARNIGTPSRDLERKGCAEVDPERERSLVVERERREREVSLTPPTVTSPPRRRAGEQ
jgi:hypothetical protein